MRSSRSSDRVVLAGRRSRGRRDRRAPPRAYDADAKALVATVVDTLGFAPVDLGALRTGRLMQVDGGPLSGLHALKLA